MPPVYKLRIEGCKPETLPMARLAEYMADFAALLGEPEHVHFADLAKGSAVLAAKVEPVAAAKVDSRLAAVAGRKATGDLHRAARALNNRLAADNATGSLTGAARSNAKAALLVKFPGREGPKPIDYGIVREESSLDGVLIGISIRGKTANLTLRDWNRTWTGIKTTPGQARKIAKHLGGKTLRLHGTGDWWRDKNGQWQLKRFQMDKLQVLKDTPLPELVEQLRAIPGSGWREVEDPAKVLRELRYGPDDGPS